MAENKFKLEPYDGRNPMTVPEGYFDTLTQRVMANLSAEEKPKVISLKPRNNRIIAWCTTAAACLIGAIVYFAIPHTDSELPPVKVAEVETTVTPEDKYQEDVMNYAMVDYDDVYYYLSGTEI